MLDFISILASIVAVLFVFIPHEIAHGYVAFKNGDCTAKIYGRLTLNPIKHIEPIGIMLCIFTGFGWAKPVPINPSNFKNYKKGLFTTAIAGCTVNYIIAFLVYPLYAVIFKFALPTVLYNSFIYYFLYFIERIFYLIFLYSLSVFVFNLLPFYPLDGFRVVESLTRQINPITRFLKNYGYYILIGLVVESFICNFITRFNVPYINYFNILGYVQWFARNVIGYPITALWNLIIGL